VAQRRQQTSTTNLSARPRPLSQVKEKGRGRKEAEMKKRPLSKTALHTHSRAGQSTWTFLPSFRLSPSCDAHTLACLLFSCLTCKTKDAAQDIEPCSAKQSSYAQPDSNVQQNKKETSRLSLRRHLPASQLHRRPNSEKMTTPARK